MSNNNIIVPISQVGEVLEVNGRQARVTEIVRRPAVYLAKVEFLDDKSAALVRPMVRQAELIENIAPGQQ